MFYVFYYYSIFVNSSFIEKRAKRSFVSMSSVRQTKYGRSSYRLVREQRMLDKAEGFASLSSVRQTKYGRSSYRLVREQRMLATITIKP